MNSFRFKSDYKRLSESRVRFIIQGALLMSSISNTIGRKTFLLACGLGLSISYLGLAFTKTITGVLILRFIIGACAVVEYLVGLVFVGEIASTEIRGMLLGSSAIFSNLGLLVVYTTGGLGSYRFVNLLALALGVIFKCGVSFAPETPIYLILKGREEEAKAVLIALNRKEDADNIMELSMEIQKSTTNHDWKALFTEKSNRRALMITFILNILQQGSGPSIMGSYTTTIFEIAGSSITPYVATIIIGVVQVLSGMITPLFVERCGRKILLFLSTTLTGLSLLSLAIYLYLYDGGHPSVAQLKWLPLVVYIVYCVSYAFGFSVLPAALIGELFQMNVCSMGSGIVFTVACTRISGVICSSTFGYIVSALGIHVAIGIFSGPCFLASLFTIFCVPETKGKSLIEVQKMLSK